MIRSEFDGCLELWSAVIMRAIADAATNDPELSREKDLARNWLSTPSSDLARVCDLADVNYQSVLKRFQTVAKMRWPRATMKAFLNMGNPA